MRRVAVQSSNIASVGYDPTSSTLEIEFHNGGIYQYSNVPESIYNGIMSAASKGTYFDQYIKKGGYGYRKIQ
jgi:hypothetical protein